MSGRLADRVALVTGAGGGIGRAIAARLAAEGAIVVVNDLDAAACEGIPSAVTAAPGDVTDPAAAAAIVAAVRERHGRLDVLVNNAGVVRDAPIHRMTDEDWRLVHDVGLWGGFCMCRAAAELLRAPADHHRKVVNMSSSVGLHGAAGGGVAGSRRRVVGLRRPALAKLPALELRL